ncbi:hypothetical protein [Candidatus Paracaedibacter symbiosus]|uniref:hypothetical protein n=1 Tax=Candidatus Paracaedibacter symbiosus TaxID=244582 RepID=UPI000509E275|nr:hypothetical protein [Candidatus Paracaedibacter symbiosus]
MSHSLSIKRKIFPFLSLSTFLFPLHFSISADAMEKEDDLSPPHKKMRLNPTSEKEKVYNETTSFEQLPPKGIENFEE